VASKSGVTANTLHPGVLATGFARNNGPGMNFAMTIVRPFAISPERGAQTPSFWRRRRKWGW
jgi:hypothetical protein